jgi:4-carboxymuconolactone decarboxylase
MFEEGLKTRKAVLGDDFVDQQFDQASDFSKPLQGLVTEFCFGAVRSRNGLSRRDRSLINIALLAPTNRSHALHYHVKAALTNGATEEEIRETLDHLILYCGLPTAFDAFEVAEKALHEEGEETPTWTNEGAGTLSPANPQSAA